MSSDMSSFRPCSILDCEAVSTADAKGRDQVFLSNEVGSFRECGIAASAFILSIKFFHCLVRGLQVVLPLRIARIDFDKPFRYTNRSLVFGQSLRHRSLGGEDLTQAVMKPR